MISKPIHPPIEEWKTKREAASILGVSEKTIERYAEKGQLARKERRIPGRVPLPVFSPDDIARIQKETMQPTPAGASPAPGANLARISPRGDVVTLLAELLRAREPTPSSKMFLTIEEAAAHSGLSETYLRRKIKAGELVALKDRGWKIRRGDLDKL